MADWNEFLAQRYGPSAMEEWQQVQRLLELRHGFSLIILLVPDQDAANLCHHAFSAHLAGQNVLNWPMLGPENLYELPDRLLRLSIERDNGAIFISGVVPGSHPEQPSWATAWRYAAERLNERRDVLRARIQGPLVLCGASWLAPLLREEAPDLWSVRTLVVRILPSESAPEAAPVTPDCPELPQDSIWRFVRGSTTRAFAIFSDFNTPAVLREIAAGIDPHIALSKAAPLRLSSSPGTQKTLAALLLRAAYGFAVQRNASETLRVSDEVSELLRTSSGPQPDRSLLCQSSALKAWGELLHGRFAEAVENAEQAVALGSAEDAAGDTEFIAGLRLAYGVYWMAAVSLDRSQDADAALAALERLEPSGLARLITAAEVERVGAIGQHLRGQHAAAILHLNRALALQERAGVAPLERAHTLALIANCQVGQKALDDAERSIRRALLLFGPSSDTSTKDAKFGYGFILAALGELLYEQGRFRESIDPLGRAASLLQAGEAEWIVPARVRFFHAAALIRIGGFKEAVAALKDLLREDTARGPHPQRQRDIGKLLYLGLLLMGERKLAHLLLAEVAQRFSGSEELANELKQFQDGLRTVRRFGWLLMPVVRSFWRLGSWLTAQGWHPQQLRERLRAGAGQEKP